MSSIRDLIETPHPIYSRNVSAWNFYLDSYEGGQDYTQASMTNNNTGDMIKIKVAGKVIQDKQRGNLFMHKKERSDDYINRVKMSYYYNFCAPIIDIYSNHLFKEPIVEDFKGINETTFASIENDVDRMGSAISEFRKQIADMAQVFGHVFIVCDKPRQDERVPIQTLADKIENKVFPYFVSYMPQSVVNWSLDSFGRPYWVLIQEDTDFNDNPFNIVTDRKAMYQYKLWTRQEWIIYDADYNERERGAHGLGYVPIVCFFDKHSKKAKNFLGISALADISLIARDVYNSCSELRQILRDQTFSILAVQGNASDYSETTVGTNRGIVYPVGSAAPQYIAPPSQNAEIYFQHIDRQVSKMFQIAKLEGGSAEFSGQDAVEQSGVSKAWDFNQTNSALAQKAGNLEDGETKLWKIFANQDGTQWEGYVNYPDEFSVKSLMDDLTEAEKLVKLQLGKTFDLTIKEAIVRKKFPRVPEDKLQEMIDEIPETPENNGLSVKSRLPFLFKQDANSSGKNGG